MKVIPPDSRPPSLRRRYLLKAASAGSVLATLPSAEALAQASAIQCAINEQAGLNQPPPDPTNASSQGYLRVAGEKRTYFTNTSAPAAWGPYQFIEAYYFLDLNGDPILVVGEANATPANPLGSWFNSNWAFGYSSTPAEFLYLYYADYPIVDASSVKVDTGTGQPTQCDITIDFSGATGATWADQYDGTSTPAPPTPNPTSPYHCNFPFAVQVVSPPSAGNMALAASCLTSFV